MRMCSAIISIGPGSRRRRARADHARDRAEKLTSPIGDAASESATKRQAQCLRISRHADRSELLSARKKVAFDANIGMGRECDQSEAGQHRRQGRVTKAIADKVSREQGELNQEVVPDQPAALRAFAAI